jgi:outer membrane protein assembly factor BamE (lipoprotein component of BamABCDE complex)
MAKGETKMKPASRSAILVLALLAGCASSPFTPTSVVPGDTRDDVVRKMGPPTGQYTMRNGLPRLEYTRMPSGKKTYMIDFDAAGRVTQWQQVLDDAHFQQIAVGMRREDVLSLIGPPTTVWDFHRPRPGYSWFYRYESPLKCQGFDVTFDTGTGAVTSTGYPPDPACPFEYP